jgi:hypothetical protein
MKPVSGIAKLVAAASAVCVTFGLVWSVANAAYPGSSHEPVQLAKGESLPAWELTQKQ